MANEKQMQSQQEFLKSYELWADALFRHIHFRVFDREIAKDLLQDVFMRAWEYIASGKEIEQMRAFLYRVANNSVIDHVRKKKSVSLDELSENEGFDPSDNSHARIKVGGEFSQAMEVLRGLDEQTQELLVMRYLDGFGPKEIAEIISESENVVSVRLNRAIKKAQKLIGVILDSDRGSKKQT